MQRASSSAKTKVKDGRVPLVFLNVNCHCDRFRGVLEVVIVECVDAVRFVAIRYSYHGVLVTLRKVP